MKLPWNRGGSGGSGEQPFQPQPDKAKKFFEHASTAAASSNFEFALQLYADGLKLDPGNMAAHQAMYEAAVRYVNGGGKPATGKELRKIDDGGTKVSKMAAAEFTWMKDLNSLAAATRLLEAASEAEQHALGQWLAPKVMALVKNQARKKPSKSLMVQAKDAFAGVGAWDEAFICADEALKIDPSDGKLASELKQLTAARAIQQGGYNQTVGQAGGFRSNVRDMDKQRALEEAGSLSGGADVEARNLERARKEYEDNPLSPEAIRRFADLLKRKQTPEGEDEARQVLMAGFNRTGEYRFKMAASDIRISQMRRELKTLRERVEAAPADEEARAAMEAAKRALLEFEVEESRERTSKYPTDRVLKFDAGRLAFELGKVEEAMGHFQAAKDEPKLRVTAAAMLGRCFAAEGWHSEAIGEYREALAAIDATTSQHELDVKYELMLSLIELARAEKSSAHAKEAADICSAILRKDISYRDIRSRRKDLDTLVKELG